MANDGNAEYLTQQVTQERYMAKKGLPPFMKKGMKEGSKAEQAADKKMGVKFPPKGKMPAFKKGGAVKKGC